MQFIKEYNLCSKECIDKALNKQTCDELVKIDYAATFGSLNVSNATAVALYATKPK